MSREDLGESLLSTIAKSGATDLLVEVGEFSLDQLLDENFVKDVPVFGTLIKFYKIGVGVHDYMFARKLQRFLVNLHDIPQEERNDFGARMDKDQDLKRRVGEHTILTLDRLDDMGKPELMARAFRAFIRGDFHFDMLQRFWTAIDRCLIVDLETLRQVERKKDLETHVVQMLSSVGLLEIKGSSYGGRIEAGVYDLTDFGKLFARVIFDADKRAAEPHSEE